jgi:hypothetical protein
MTFNGMFVLSDFVGVAVDRYIYIYIYIYIIFVCVCVCTSDIIVYLYTTDISAVSPERLAA